MYLHEIRLTSQRDSQYDSATNPERERKKKTSEKEKEREKIFPIKIYSLLPVGILLTRWGQSFAGMFDAFNVFANCNQKLRLLSTTIKF